MKSLSIALIALPLVVAGCAKPADEKPATMNPTNTSADMGLPPKASPDAPPTANTNPLPGKTPPTPVPIENGVVTLSPENTRIEFVGTHSGENPDPRTGTFTKFSGKIEVDAAAKAVKSITIDIDATTIATAFEKLTAHLNSPDFFDSQEFPTAKFASTEITPDGGEGQFTVKGDLTLHGVTKQVSFPIKSTISDKDFTSKSEFSIDRTHFGMDAESVKGKVENNVSLTIIVGEKNVVPAIQKGP
jgi:polyisoprenoid-binding protein YceI